MAEANIRNDAVFARADLPPAAEGIGAYPPPPEPAAVLTPQMGMCMQTPVWTRIMALPECHMTLLTRTAVEGLWGEADAEFLSSPLGLSAVKVVSNGFSAFCDIDTDTSGSMATMAFQMAGPHVPAAQVAAADIAATWIQRIAMVLLANDKTCCTSMFPRLADSWAEARAAGQEGAPAGALHGVNFNSDNDADQFPLSFTTGNLPPLAAAVRFILYVAEKTKEETSPILSALVGTVIAITKRGNITRSKLRNVLSELSKTTNKELTCDHQDIRHIYDVIGRTINRNNARNYFDAVRAMCGMNQGMRLSLMAQQASLAGLTQIVCIRMALHNHPTFPWVRLFEMWPSQMIAVQNALTAIGNNPFYGFDSDLGQVRSTLYKDVFVVAKKLLVRLDGCSTLSNYEGGKSMCANSEEIEAMIERYIRHQSAPPQGAYSEDVLQRTANLLTSADNSDRLTMDAGQA